MSPAQRMQVSTECFLALRRGPQVDALRDPRSLAEVVRRGFVQWSSGAVRSVARLCDGAAADLPPALRTCRSLLEHAARGLDAAGLPWTSGLSVLPALRALRLLSSHGSGVLFITGHLGALVLAISERLPSGEASGAPSSWMLVHVQASARWW